MMDSQDFPPEIPPAPPNSPAPIESRYTLFQPFTIHIFGLQLIRDYQQLQKMVQLTEVVDEHFQSEQPGPEDDDDYTDTESEISNDSEYDPTSESLTERLFALRDIIPPYIRSSVAGKFNATTSAVSSTLSFTGKSLWVISTTALILGVPWALAWAEEQQVIEMEKEMKMREMGGELLTGGASSPGGSATAQQVSAALGKEAHPAL
ncbi:hypothetical protein AAE478_003308 [Parahypoxylon ruwenzoriense]